MEVFAPSFCSAGTISHIYVFVAIAVQCALLCAIINVCGSPA